MGVEQVRINDQPDAIQAKSFRIVEEELGTHSFSELEFAIIRRVIYATADFDFAKNFVFHPQAISSGVEAIRQGKGILVDVSMIEAGVRKGDLKRFGGEVRCFIYDNDVIEQAKALNATRARMAMRKGSEFARGGIVVIGNAPTALFETIDLIQKGETFPALVIGVPVGFVSASESKEALLHAPIPYITSLGRKGGSPVAVAVVNALIELAQNR